MSSAFALYLIQFVGFLLLLVVGACVIRSLYSCAVASSKCTVRSGWMNVIFLFLLVCCCVPLFDRLWFW